MDNNFLEWNKKKDMVYFRGAMTGEPYDEKK